MTDISTVAPLVRTLKGQRPMKGRPYSLAEFSKKYGLDSKEALRLFKKFGPSATELDLLMAAKRHSPQG